MYSTSFSTHNFLYSSYETIILVNMYAQLQIFESYSDSLWAFNYNSMKQWGGGAERGIGVGVQREG